jgi:hypothetical protein
MRLIVSLKSSKGKEKFLGGCMHGSFRKGLGSPEGERAGQDTMAHILESFAQGKLREKDEEHGTGLRCSMQGS